MFRYAGLIINTNEDFNEFVTNGVRCFSDFNMFYWLFKTG